MITHEAAPAKPRKKLSQRALPEHSQALRRAFQFSFLLLNGWIGAQFYLFVRYYETGGHSMWMSRPAGVEGWLPIASLMNLKVLLLTGRLPTIHPAGTLLLIAFLAASWIFRKSFCGWLCPVGTVSEYLWRLGRKLFGRSFRLPRVLDIPLRGLKYILMGLFLYVVAAMSVGGIRQFLESPYGALMGLAALVSPLRIRRDVSLCIDCAKCAKACPSALPVDRLITIRSAECMGCMQCVAACPAEAALYLSAPRRGRVPAWAVAAGIAALFFGTYTYARWSGHWNTDLPSSVYFQLVPHANEFAHP